MRKNFSIIFFLLILLSENTIESKIKFSSRESRIGVSGGSLYLSSDFDVVKGTFEVDMGSISGANIFFDDGQYRLNRKKADIDGTLLSQGSGYVLEGNESISADPGMQINPLLVMGAGNILAGNPDLQGTNTLLNEFSELQVNIANRFAQSLLMNNGTLTLLNDLALGDDVVLTGSGKLNLNNKTLRMPAKESVWSSNLLFNQANDVVLNAKTFLSGVWTFSGLSPVLQGNGNILDLTAGGTLRIAPGSELACADIHIRGIGDLYGAIIFEGPTSRMRFSNVSLTLASNYTFTQGGIYAEGGMNLFITGTNFLTFDYGSSLSIDRVTVYGDSLDATPTVNVFPNMPDGLRLIYLNNGIMVASDAAEAGLDTALGIATSNAVAGLLVAVSNAVVTQDLLITENSNAIIGLSQGVTNNSGALIGWVQDTSNAMVSLQGLVAANSSAIESLEECCVSGSWAVLALNDRVTENSWSIQSLSESVGANSWAILGLNELGVGSSNAIIGLSQGITDNSNALVGWAQDTSNAMGSFYQLLVDVSDAVVSHSAVSSTLSIENSNAIVSWIQDTSNAMVSLQGLVASNSWAIESLEECCMSGSWAILALNDRVTENSWSIQSLSESVGANSWAILGLNELGIENSNAIVGLSQGIADNSNALVGWVQDTSNAMGNFYQLLVEVSNAVVFYSAISSTLPIENSNAIISWIQDTSNAMVSLQGLVEANSWAIESLEECCISGSWAILALNDRVAENSNALVGWVQDTSNIVDSLYDFVVENSNAIVGVSQGVTDNSQAIIGWIMDTSDAMVSVQELADDNSWGILAVLDRIISPTTRYLLEQHPTASVVMDESLFLHQGHKINVHGDMSIDGSGGVIYFSDPTHSQLLLQPNVKLTIRNITFANLHQHNIYIPASSELVIDENVTFYLAKDMTFSVGKITVTGEANIFTVHGYGGTKHLAFGSLYQSSPFVFDLGSSSLVLQDIELTGLSSIQNSSIFIGNELIAGGIVCAGRTQINIDQSNTMNFLIENIDNVFKMRANNLALRGAISYGIAPLNTLNIQFSLLNPVTESYRLILGDNTLYVYSDVGSAYILFNDFLVEIFNEGSNSFLLDARSGLFGQNLFIQNFPIKLLSTQFTLDQYLQLATDQANAIDTSFVRSAAGLCMQQRPQLAYQAKRLVLAPVEE